jgi:hypothetical protein
MGPTIHFVFSNLEVLGNKCIGQHDRGPLDNGTVYEKIMRMTFVLSSECPLPERRELRRDMNRPHLR